MKIAVFCFYSSSWLPVEHSARTNCTGSDLLLFAKVKIIYTCDVVSEGTEGMCVEWGHSPLHNIGPAQPNTRGVCFAWSAWLHLKKKTVEGLFVAFLVFISSPGFILLCSSFPCYLGQLNLSVPKFHTPETNKRTWDVRVHFCRLVVEKWPNIFMLKVLCRLWG